jgi:hypothetical protein
VAQVVDHLFSKCEALSSNSSTKNIKNKIANVIGKKIFPLKKIKSGLERDASGRALSKYKALSSNSSTAKKEKKINWLERN